ncbi:MAG: LytTR family DNA-binding domain-containing protein [Mucilaginibacter sp.]
MKINYFARDKPAEYKIAIQAFVFVLCAIFITTLQDLIHAYYNHYTFYLSESLLYKSFWILFLPLAVMQVKTLNYLKSYTGKSRIASLLGITTFPVVLHLILFALVLQVLSALLFDHTYYFFKSLEYTVRDDLYKLVLVYGFIAYIFLYKKRPLTTVETASPESLPASIAIKDGRKNIVVNVSDIIYISSENPYVAIHTVAGRYLQPASLKQMAGQLDATKFVRIHRSAIVNLAKVSAYTSRLNGDFDITLQNGEITRMSRNYTALFKKHFPTASA